MMTCSVVLIRKLINLSLALCLAGLAVACLGCSENTSPSFQQGQKIFETYCIACHGTNGAGVLYSKSALDKDKFVTGDYKKLIPVILYGKAGAGTMPGWQDTLSDQEIAAVATYIRQAWSNRADPVTPAMVQEIRKTGG